MEKEKLKRKILRRTVKTIPVTVSPGPEYVLHMAPSAGGSVAIDSSPSRSSTPAAPAVTASIAMATTAPALLKYHYTRDELLSLQNSPLSNVKPVFLTPVHELYDGCLDADRMRHTFDEPRSGTTVRKNTYMGEAKSCVNPVGEYDNDHRIVLVPQRSSFDSGCHVVSGRMMNSPETKRDRSRRDGHRIGSGRIQISEKLVDKDLMNHHHHASYDCENIRDDRRYGRGGGGGGGGGMGNGARLMKRYYDGKHSEAYRERRHFGGSRNDVDEPEWFTEGPMSQLETIELRGFECLQKGKNLHQEKPQFSASPVQWNSVPRTAAAVALETVAMETQENICEGAVKKNDEVYETSPAAITATTSASISHAATSIGGSAVVALRNAVAADNTGCVPSLAPPPLTSPSPLPNHVLPQSHFEKVLNSEAEMQPMPAASLPAALLPAATPTSLPLPPLPDTTSELDLSAFFSTDSIPGLNEMFNFEPEPTKSGSRFQQWFHFSSRGNSHSESRRSSLTDEFSYINDLIYGHHSPLGQTSSPPPSNSLFGQALYPTERCLDQPSNFMEMLHKTTHSDATGLCAGTVNGTGTDAVKALMDGSIPLVSAVSDNSHRKYCMPYQGDGNVDAKEVEAGLKAFLSGALFNNSLLSQLPSMAELAIAAATDGAFASPSGAKVLLAEELEADLVADVQSLPSQTSSQSKGDRYRTVKNFVPVVSHWNGNNSGTMSFCCLPVLPVGTKVTLLSELEAGLKDAGVATLAGRDRISGSLSELPCETNSGCHGHMLSAAGRSVCMHGGSGFGSLPPPQPPPSAGSYSLTCQPSELNAYKKLLGLMMMEPHSHQPVGQPIVTSPTSASMSSLEANQPNNSLANNQRDFIQRYLLQQQQLKMLNHSHAPPACRGSALCPSAMPLPHAPHLSSSHLVQMPADFLPPYLTLSNSTLPAANLVSSGLPLTPRAGSSEYELAGIRPPPPPTAGFGRSSALGPPLSSLLGLPQDELNMISGISPEFHSSLAAGLSGQMNFDGLLIPPPPIANNHLQPESPRNSVHTAHSKQPQKQQQQQQPAFPLSLHQQQQQQQQQELQQRLTKLTHMAAVQDQFAAGVKPNLTLINKSVTKSAIPLPLPHLTLQPPPPPMSTRLSPGLSLMSQQSLLQQPPQSPRRATSPIVFGNQPPMNLMAPLPVNLSPMTPVLSPTLSPNTLQVNSAPPPQPGSNLSSPVMRVPSPQELSGLAQSILQNALIKKQLEEQKERFIRRQQERNKSPKSQSATSSVTTSVTVYGSRLPNGTNTTASDSTPEMAGKVAPAFLPTSVLRKMANHKIEEKSTGHCSEGEKSVPILNVVRPDDDNNTELEIKDVKKQTKVITENGDSSSLECLADSLQFLTDDQLSEVSAKSGLNAEASSGIQVSLQAQQHLSPADSLLSSTKAAVPMFVVGEDVQQGQSEEKSVPTRRLVGQGLMNRNMTGRFSPTAPSVLPNSPASANAFISSGRQIKGKKALEPLAIGSVASKSKNKTAEQQQQQQLPHQYPTCVNSNSCAPSSSRIPASGMNRQALEFAKLLEQQRTTGLISPMPLGTPLAAAAAAQFLPENSVYAGGGGGGATTAVPRLLLHSNFGVNIPSANAMLLQRLAYPNLQRSGMTSFNQLNLNQLALIQAAHLQAQLQQQHHQQQLWNRAARNTNRGGGGGGGGGPYHQASFVPSGSILPSVSGTTSVAAAKRTASVSTSNVNGLKNFVFVPVSGNNSSPMKTDNGVSSSVVLSTGCGSDGADGSRNYRRQPADGGNRSTIGGLEAADDRSGFMPEDAGVVDHVQKAGGVSLSSADIGSLARWFGSDVFNHDMPPLVTSGQKVLTVDEIECWQHAVSEP